MEAASLPRQQPPPGKRAADFVSGQILWILLGAALLILFLRDPQQTAENVKDGLSVGLIWALIALGYTLVYGIIELINFAHGEVFMIGAFVSVSLYGGFGITAGTNAALITIGIIPVLLIAMFASGIL